MGEISRLKGLGPKSEQWLNSIGIETEAQLRELGPVRVYLRLKGEGSINPSLNLLYAMVGALENRHWTDISQSEKARLLMELEGYQELEAILRAEGIPPDF